MHYVVTGANRGIGLEFARQLAQQGNHVTATARDVGGAVALHELAAAHSGRVRVAPLDHSDPASVSALAGSIEGPVDVLINNAGAFMGEGALGSIDYAVIEQNMLANAIGPLRLTEALLPALRHGTTRLVATVSSRMGSVGDNTSGGYWAYRMSKAAVNMAMKSLAVGLAPEGFRVVALNPGWVQTDMGGPNAQISAGESVAGMLGVIGALSTADSGSFFDWRGNRVPW